ncbi:MAG TPA: cupredoxin family protein [Pseudolabrys sp.]|jgi:uncharacterized cupredoxin-like copper-binding protein|nr:cupredoxin family protein [Pseudolabrys sp.]
MDLKKLISAFAAAALLATIGLAAAHEGEHFSAGVPGNAKKPARTVTVVMSDDEGAMKFTPDRLEVKKGEQVRFVIQNKGALKHEFMLASVKDNDKHAEMMKKFPDMEHDDPNAKSVDPGKTAEMVWRFTKTGTFEFACLIPGHREAGMHGSVTVK